MFISPAVAGDRVFIGSCGGSVYALDRASGKPVWEYDTGEDGPRAQFHGEAIVTGSTLVVPSDVEPASHLYAFDQATGEVRWKMKFEGGVFAAPLLFGKSIVAAGMTGKLARIDLASGKVLWSMTPDGVRPSMPRITSPTSDGKRVYFGSNSGKLFAIDAAKGNVVWKTETTTPFSTSLLHHGTAIYAGGEDRHLHVFDAATGKLRQRIPLGGRPYGTLVVAPPLLITLVVGKPYRLVALDLTTMKTRWERTADREWSTFKPLVHDGAVIAGSEERKLCAYALRDGAERWCTAMPQVPRGLGTAGGTLYVGTLNGRVLAYRQR